MTPLKKRKKADTLIGNMLPISKLFPSIITLLALCFGLTSIRYGFDQKWEHSVTLIIIAALLDGMDGRIARYLNATSDFGAQLDSLADFINFGVAPAIILYLWTLSSIPIKGVGWGFVLIFSVCCAIRLARFNVSARDSANKLKDIFFDGVNAPIGAVLAINPIVLSFEFDINFIKNPWFIGIYVVLMAFAMASRIPTFSIKKLSIPRKNAALVLAFFGLFIAALVIKPWIVIPTLSLLYILSIPVSIAVYYKKVSQI
jgi:CDP-diacylglycerol---serine O-phosphatidyltransferase